MSLLEYLRVLARHKLLVVVIALLAPAAALYFSLAQEPRFEASAEVFLNRQNLASALTSIPNPNADVQPELLTATEARLARVPEVARRALDAAGVRDRTAADLLDDSTVAGDPDADLLVFTVTDVDPAVAAALATAYAREFTEYRFEIETGSLRTAGEELDDRLSELRAAGSRKTALYRALAAKRRELYTLEALQTDGASVIRRAADVTQTQPRPVRALALSAPLGILFAMALALVAHFLDTRVWSAREIARRLRLPLLGRVPDLPRRFRPSSGLLMLDRPRSPHAGAFRALRATLELANAAHDAATIVFTSAGRREGKSTTVANLGVALARAGKDVVLVDLDVRRPALARLFGVHARPGVGDVLSGGVQLEEALAAVRLRENEPARRHTAGPRIDLGGSLRVLPAERLAAGLADVAGTPAIAGVLERAQVEAELVLVDAPPLLDGGEALALSAQVDALVLVTRAGKARRAVLADVRHLVAGTPAVKLGVVVTAADVDGDEADSGPAALVDGAFETPPALARR